MGKSFKLRFSKVIASFHSSCRSKDSYTLPENPVPSSKFFTHNKPTTKFISLDNLSLINQPPCSKSYNLDQHTPCSSFKRHVSEYKWRKEEKFHVVATICDDPLPRRKISNSKMDILGLPQPLTPPRLTHVEKKKNKSRVKKKKTKGKIRMSTSSADESGMFSSETWDEVDNKEEEEEETETLVSSCRSFEFSTDSSTDFNPQLETICETTTMRRHKRSKRRSVKHSSRPSFSSSRGRRSSVSTSSDSEVPARLSVFKKLIPCSVDGKVKESFAIVKKSQDPYEDFKRSMMEMILEKQMFERNELEQLLQCFLSLNGKHYHGVIVEAFSDIWETLFVGTNDDRARRLSTNPQPSIV